MNRKSVRLLLVLLILPIIPLSSCIGVYSGFTHSPRNPSIVHETIVSNIGTPTLTWTSRWQSEPQSVENDSIIVGDHVVIESTWDESVTSSRMTVSRGFNETRFGPIVGPIITEWPIDIANYSWETFEGIEADNEVRIEVNVTQNGDAAFDVMPWIDLNSDNEVSIDELGSGLLLSVDQGGVGTPEFGSFVSDLPRSIAIRVWCWSYAYSANMTYELHADTGFEINIDNDPGTPDTVVYDTYNLLQNITVDITLRAWNASEVFVVEFEGVTFCNYFAPVLSEISMYEVSDNVWDFSWTCADGNANDTNYFSFWLSSDNGVSFYLLALNLSEPHYVWDSFGFSLRDYVVRVIAYSLDLTFGDYCSTEAPPSSYWPGDYSVRFADVRAGIYPLYPPGYYEIDLMPALDVSYVESSIGNVITWHLEFQYNTPDSVDYVVYCDGSEWTSGSFHPLTEEMIEVNVDGLSSGFYVFEIEIDQEVTDSVYVYVSPRTGTPYLIQSILFGVSIGSSVVIIVVIILTIRLRWNNKSHCAELFPFIVQTF